MTDKQIQELLRINADLLAALEAFLEDAPGGLIPDCACERCTRYRNAYNAIAKAKGETP